MFWQISRVIWRKCKMSYFISGVIVGYLIHWVIQLRFNYKMIKEIDKIIDLIRKKD